MYCAGHRPEEEAACIESSNVCLTETHYLWLVNIPQKFVKVKVCEIKAYLINFAATLNFLIAVTTKKLPLRVACTCFS